MKRSTLKTVCVCGHFGFGRELLNGQTVKTKILADELIRVFGRENVLLADTHGGVKKLVTLPVQCLKMLRECRNIVILPAQNGLRVIAPVIACGNLFFGRKIHYAVIGGWLPAFLENRKMLCKVLKSFNGIYVETSVMKKTLEEKGFRNIFVMPNCKKLEILKESELVRSNSEPYRLCTFSRVMKEKGIEDAVEAVKAVNAHFGRIVYCLDIYGQVDKGQEEWFDALHASFPDEIRYCGAVAFDKSTEVLRGYFALLFPTRFYTEGIPGTIIDAYAAGTPVIASRWESFGDIIDDVTGIGYTFGDEQELKQILMKIPEETDSFRAKASACLERARNYMPEMALKPLIMELSRKTDGEA